MSVSTPAKPSFSTAEIKQREYQLMRCFTAINTSGTGTLTNAELEFVAKLFNPAANDWAQESKIILNKLDMNHDGVIDSREWVTGLLDLFKFMNDGAFNKHIDELIQYVTRGTQAQSSPPPQAKTPVPA